MARPDEIRTQQHARFFRQDGNARPNNEIFFSGVDTQHMVISAASDPLNGGITPVRAPDPFQRKKYQNVGITETPPDFPTATLTLLEDHGAIPWHHADLGCGFTLYEAIGKCQNPSDFLRGWETMSIYSQNVATARNRGARGAWDTDDRLETTLEMSVTGGIYDIGGVTFGEEAATPVATPVKDVVYGTSAQCGDCGPENNGTRWIYALAESDGAAAPAKVVYSVDFGGTWSSGAIAGIGTTEAVFAIDVVGPYLVVIGDEAYYYALINPATGVPGAFTKITTGIVASNGPLDMYVASASSVWFSGAGGYIYKSTDITAGVSVVVAGDLGTDSLNRIHGNKETIVAIGVDGLTVKSINGGVSFSATTVPAVANFTALWVFDRQRFWAGQVGGGVYYTLNGGATWTSKGTALTNVQDIVFATDEVGWMAGRISSAGYVLATFDGGYNWVQASTAGGRMLSAPTYDTANRVAVPKQADLTTATNNLVVGGVNAVTTDGVIYLGAAAIR